MPNTKMFRIGYGILLAFLIIWVGVKINFIFYPFVVMFETLFAPLLISLVLFYLLRPLVDALEKRRLPRSIAILAVYVAIAAVMTLLILAIAPMIKQQFTDLIAALPSFIHQAITFALTLTENQWFAQFLAGLNIDLQQTAQSASQFAMQLINMAGSHVTGMIGFVANLFVVAFVIPFILYYFLKDGHKMTGGFIRFLSEKRRSDGRKLLSEMDRTISMYIRGQMTVAVCVGVMLFIGFQIIGLKYSVLLACIAMATNIIPYLGPLLAGAPAVLVGLSQSPWMALQALIVTIIAQQIEGNLISPKILGKGLNIHPLTIILLLLVVGTLVGPLGLILAVPLYAVTKIFAVYVYKFIRLRTELDVEDT